MQNTVKYAVGLIFAFVCSLSADPLRVLPVMSFRYNPTSRDAFVKTMMPLLEQSGISFVTTNPDLVMICGRAKREVCEKFSQYPVVILDEEESASLDPETRECVKLSYVKAVYKNTVLREREKYNYPSVGTEAFSSNKNYLGNNSYHFKIISDSCKKLPLKKLTLLTNQELKKIQCMLWDTFRGSLKDDLQTIKDEAIDFNQERPVDASFACTMRVNEFPGFHRQQALRRLKAVRGYNIAIETKWLQKKDYFKLLKSSKIVISPWGLGEWCWRDYEAIHTGAILIKPDTSFVQAVPDLYQNDLYYVPCKADFSDLGEKIAYVLKNYSKFIEMRKRAKKLLVDNWNHEMHAKKLAQALKKIVSEYRNEKERV